MGKTKIKPKNVHKLDDYRVHLTAVLKCADCSYLHQAAWPSYVAIEDLHCPNCSNQSLRVYEPEVKE